MYSRFSFSLVVGSDKDDEVLQDEPAEKHGRPIVILNVFGLFLSC